MKETRKQMLERGISLLDDETGRLPEGAALPGAVAFKLYDTFGFPLDLTQDALREQGKDVDIAGFNAAMDEQRARARAAWAGSGKAATETVWFELKEQLGGTEFLGYTVEQAEGEKKIRDQAANLGEALMVAETGEDADADAAE